MSEQFELSTLPADFDELRRTTYHPPKLSFFDKLAAFFLCDKSNSEDLNDADRAIATYISSECAVHFDSKNASHVKLFAELHYLAFGKQAPNPLKSDSWTRFGFQSNKPEADIRSGGLLSVEVLHHIAKEYPDFVGEVLQHIDTVGNYFFACSVISSTFFIKQYFSFGEKWEGGQCSSGSKMPHKDNLKLLLSLMRRESNNKQDYKKLFISLIAVYAIRLFDHWKLLEDENPLIVVSFTQVMTEFESSFHKFMKQNARNPPSNFAELIYGLKLKRFHIKV